ncbi:MAG: nucleoside 2-deoxyribosyltransferase [Armatimonadota bacterium]|nr:nucleoside 2-deoxyribosyltransferase [Armatimonadota bacterium]MDR7451880.1 nucleoside 2-deoxyribosyltransferase [Armatimonadota bacterium]MDR7467605.1 nucleoside 2-deoxyribosyltransferase [Armatimonadota bacterium]MDR7494434.1 nucleoside 2-deoxyribosyltransferase [Armatimonadota bacterium]MDR7500414.1 nucleoside 2-deoxyribosyltransferase [Armatimonadota bacterium]
MTAPFECEVRFFLRDPEAFHRRLRDLGGRVREAYAFTDHYHRPAGPAGGEWDGRTRALRIREHLTPQAGSEILLTHVATVSVAGLVVKRSLFPEGKVRLYAGALPDCRRVVDGLGFVPGVVVRKLDGRLFDVPEIGTLVTEHIDGVGWMAEIEREGRDLAGAAEEIRGALARLGVPEEEVTGEPVAVLAASRASAARAVGAGPPAAAPPQKIYFCGAIRGGRARQPLYRVIVDALQERGYQVLTTHVADPDVLEQETRRGMTAQQIYARDLRWLAASDIVVAEVSTPSLGVGVEVAEAARLGKPILALCQAGVPLSAMVAGHPALRVITYDDQADLLRVLARELPGGQVTVRSGGDDGGRD